MATWFEIACFPRKWFSWKEKLSSCRGMSREGSILRKVEEERTLSTKEREEEEEVVFVPKWSEEKFYYTRISYLIARICVTLQGFYWKIVEKRKKQQQYFSTTFVGYSRIVIIRIRIEVKNGELVGLKRSFCALFQGCWSGWKKQNVPFTGFSIPRCPVISTRALRHGEKSHSEIYYALHKHEF